MFYVMHLSELSEVHNNKECRNSFHKYQPSILLPPPHYVSHVQ